MFDYLREREMERWGIGWPAAAVVLTCAAMMIPEVSSTRYVVGANMGWTINVNYTIWAQDRHFYPGDWLFFLYDSYEMNVLEVNKGDYETCNSENPIANWTRGGGVDRVSLNMTRNYYFISGKGFCYGGMKVAVRVENPVKKIVRPAAVSAIVAVWDSFLRVW